MGNRAISAISTFSGQKPCTRVVLSKLQSILHFLKGRDIYIYLPEITWLFKEIKINLNGKINYVNTGKFQHKFHFEKRMRI